MRTAKVEFDDMWRWREVIFREQRFSAFGVSACSNSSEQVTQTVTKRRNIRAICLPDKQKCQPPTYPIRTAQFKTQGTLLN